jgi:hypothetical protein
MQGEISMTEEGASTTPHLHRPQNINLLFKAEQEAADFNQRVAIRYDQMETFQ